MSFRRDLSALATALSLLAFFTSCARAPLKPENALRKTRAPATAELNDDLPLSTLLEAIRTEIGFLEKSPADAPFVFGKETYTKAEYLAGLRRVLELGGAPEVAQDPSAFFSRLRDEFDFYEVYGRDSWGEVFMTSYYEPVLKGSKKPGSKEFTQPLYGQPQDLVSIDPSLFDPKYEGDRKLRGRQVGKSVVPYFSRAQIDSMNALKGRKLELCWVDPLEAYFLQVQGSGTVVLDDGTSLHLNYADANGMKYESVGNFLRPFIPSEQMNLHTIEKYLRSLPRDEMQKYLNMNPSYVFFRNTEQTALTYLGVPATDGRTIATDHRYFPKGALALLVFPKPVFATPDEIQPSSTVQTSRLVLDQDIGGAITGGGRLDLFWGRGPEAKRYAGVMKSPGRLYYLAPKRKPAG